MVIVAAVVAFVLTFFHLNRHVLVHGLKRRARACWKGDVNGGPVACSTATYLKRIGGISTYLP